ncbi:Hypothetical protein CINCED_3A019466 [Cinara cedri]|uniref:Uncharacterized protein n=1 Tax=Cinara cedri TaxID=506608 RepID=A0A5E4N5C4_9HEMI|nr:Hypothetical protein CINCED_3A019466 [Cinara cedri]
MECTYDAQCVGLNTTLNTRNVNGGKACGKPQPNDNNKKCCCKKPRPESRDCCVMSPITPVTCPRNPPVKVKPNCLKQASEKVQCCALPIKPMAATPCRQYKNPSTTKPNPCKKKPCGSAAPANNSCGAKCDKISCGNRDFCTLKNNECENFELTEYGKEFAQQTGRTIQNCVCIKFNGLQDSCPHPSCGIRKGCLDNPFPTCPPAKQWKFETFCKNQRMDNNKKC